ncbi:D-psicose/D-tagatose/L-ribulose 3-epimerase [Granulicella pectinivorans]|uniref:D-psicose/D-tagatose/L-ribulose 3-epimerase n=1 Tax=Granulicella pectinivorans TaxID=474950 RepID=A0A1I6M9K3_9BACT|nr:sugar phosphate isomerase/epimerase family protein [Granulicella pectinivorans]SFS12404.1 D-psicose/D-tagatose/L-ribulose 3-epimerase [Granulicella pectinivorans]
MKLGISGFAWTANFEERHLSLLPGVRTMGFEAFEVPLFDPAALPVAAIRRAFEANDLACTLCGILPAGINPISSDPVVRQRSRDHLVRSIEAAAEMGAHLLGGPLFAPIGYLPGHRSTEDEWTWAIEHFQSVVGLLEAHDVTLSIEPVNRSETFFVRTGEEAAKLCAAVGSPRIGVTIDTFHANIEEKNIAAAVESLGVHVKHMHMSENDRSLLGSGHVDFPAILRSLQRSRYEGYLMIEGFGYRASESSAPGALWADPAVSPEMLAQQGFSYLKGLLHGTA